MAKQPTYRDGETITFTTQDGKHVGTITQDLGNGVYLVAVSQGAAKGQTIGVHRESFTVEEEDEEN